MSAFWIFSLSPAASLLFGHCGAHHHSGLTGGPGAPGTASLVLLISAGLLATLFAVTQRVDGGRSRERHRGN